MAHYRNITVDGQEYRYRVGRETTKVQHLGKKTTTKFYPNAEWGTPRINQDYDQIRVNEYLGDNPRPVRSTSLGYVVMPGDVRGMILGERRWRDHPCSRHPEYIITGVCGDPFEGEIYQKGTLVTNCPACLHDSWLDT